MADEKISNEFLLEEVRLNRKEIQCLGDRIGGKVGRPEMGTWIGATLGLIALARFLGV